MSLANCLVFLGLFCGNHWRVCHHRLPSPGDISISSRVCVKTMYQTHPRNTVSSTYFPWRDRAWQHSRHTSDAKTAVAKDVWALMFKKKETTLQSSNGKSPILRARRRAWTGTDNDNIVSIWQLGLLYHHAINSSVWKHFHMVLKTTCVDRGIKINSDDVDSQKSVCHNSKVLTGTSHTFCGINTQKHQTLNVSQEIMWGQRCSPEAECKTIFWRTNHNFFLKQVKCFSTEH